MSAQMVYVHEETGTRFVWHGGEYIDVGYNDEDGEFQAVEVINVWNHAADQPRIPRTLAAFEAACDEFLAPKCDECEEPLDSWGDCINEGCSECPDHDEDEDDEQEG